MTGSSDSTRRQFVRLGAAVAAAPALARFAAAEPQVISQTIAGPGPSPGGGDPWRGLKIGVASYTFSRLPLDAAVKAVARLGVKYVSIKEAHLPLKSTAEERKAAVSKFRDAGVEPISCGVVNMPDDESAIRNAFEYARDAGIPTIVCKPTRASLATLDRMVKEFDVRLAIHNHGPEDKVWPSPLDVWDAVKSHDERIGVCIDVGHTARCGVDPAKAVRACAGRLYDMHMKDINGLDPKARPVEVGRGKLDVRGILQALIDVKFAYHVGLEFEKDMADPIPGAAESIGYIRGVLSDMRAG
jgi:sugar phosphate isomerase/epimerase